MTAKKGDRDAYLWPKRGEKGSETWDKVKEGVPSDFSHLLRSLV